MGFVRIITLLKKGSEIGVILAASSDHKSPVTVEAQDDVLVLHERIDCLLRPTIREKILTYLWWMSREQQKRTFTIPMNRNAMAEYLNVERSALSRELSYMKRDGVIDYHKNTFRLL